MTISPELEAQILRYYHAERWLIGTIAAQLGIHHDTVARVLTQAGLPPAGTPQRGSRIDPYLPFIHKTLEQFPKLTASRLYAMAQARGYPGRPDYFRHLIARHRPRPKAEAYLRLRTLPGEQSQTDWGHFGHLEIGRARRPLMAFVMVLSWSRQIFLRFFLDARMENFLRGHVGAFNTWGGLPRVLLYDNLKSAVLERQGQAIRFNPTLLQFAGHYRFEPRPVAVARGNEKGKVERAIRYIREAFFAGRSFTDLIDLNAQADAWVSGPAADRLCPGEPTLTVRAAFAQEKAYLMTLPENPYPTHEQIPVKVGKTPYVRFDLNDYSVPHTQVQRTLTVVADPQQVRILDGQQVLATHSRCYDRGQQIEIPDHIAALSQEKRQASQHRGTDRLAQAAPQSRELLTQAAQRGNNLGSITATLLHLLDRYGAAELQTAIRDALARGVPHPNAVRLALERQREARDQPPPVEIPLPDHLQSRDIPVRPHLLETYDQLMENAHGTD
ncbi:IS21 family transposase [Ferrovum myxofaciens]|uniref:Integrase core domain protein n=1 Tax=Ferrovum myxofaciens TaxID=416213 RepID=A0A149VVH1_9PROT|nr:IS21 family transposase [Ferrovum myxofaciens]KXW57225.1 integrase core domain protein [Ferrovum myxofaciens]